MSNDTLVGGDGLDTIFGGAGDDELYGGNGKDTLFGGDGSDLISGGAGADLLIGENGNDTLIADEGFELPVSGDSIYRLYRATLDREPDAEGFAQFLRIVAAGERPIENIAADFTQSVEFQAQYGSLDNEGFVTLLYANVLNRSPDPVGLNGWITELNNGASRESIVIGFSESLEFSTSTQLSYVNYINTDFYGDLYGQIYRLYRATLDRNPDEVGYQNFLDQAPDNRGLQDIASDFTQSVEFITTYGSLNNSEFVTLLYNNVLNRAPDQSGLAGWVDSLDAGTAREAIVIGFSESAEFKESSASDLELFLETGLPSGLDTLDGGAGENDLLATFGKDVFVFEQADLATNTVYGLDIADSLSFLGFGYASSADVDAHISQSGTNLVFSDQGTTVFFVNASLQEFDAVDINVI